jgi:D-inositol-3-phosphate glycosyltransferase
MRAVVVRAPNGLVSSQVEVACPPTLPISLAQALLTSTDVTAVERLELVAPPRAGDGPGAWPALAEQVVAVAGGADVAHAVDLVAGVAALSARRVTGMPVVVRAQLCGAGAAPGRRTAVRAAVLRAADAVLVPTEADRELVRGLGADPARVRLCPDAALVTHRECLDRPPRRSSRALDDAPARRYVLGLSGVPEQRSTQEGLLRALVRDKQLELVLVGAAPGRAAAHSLAARARLLRVEGRVDVRPWHDLVGLVDLVDEAAVVVVTRSEPTSALAALLAMRRGRPVVALASPPAAEVVVDGVTGRLVAPGDVSGLADAVCRTAGDGFRQLAWGQAGLDRVTARYDAAAVLASITAAYERLAPRAAPAA